VRAGNDCDNLLESVFVSDDSTAARAEWRAEESRWSRAALERWEHTRTLVDVVRDAMHRGDQVAFEFPSTVWSGDVSGVGSNVVRLATARVVVDVRVDGSVPFVLRVRSASDDGRRGDASVSTFAARLRELEGTQVSIGVLAGSLEGTLRIGHDQVQLIDDDGARTYVATGSVCWVRPVVDD